MTNPALWTAIGGVIVAVSGLIGLFLHKRNHP
jgi:hypothetical protein